MIANAAFVATLIFLALGFWSMHTLHFLTPWRNLMVYSYLKSIAALLRSAFRQHPPQASLAACPKSK